jgi:hypothetical protein
MRTVTGNSFVVIISEMTGFTTSDVNSVKAMVSREIDPLDFKYEGNMMKKRQWVVIMDSNKYEGRCCAILRYQSCLAVSVSRCAIDRPTSHPPSQPAWS